MLQVTTDHAVVQVFGGTDGLSLAATEAVFLGSGLRIPVSRSMTGPRGTGRCMTSSRLVLRVSHI